MNPLIQRLPIGNTRHRPLIISTYYSACTILIIFLYLSYVSEGQPYPDYLLIGKITLVALIPIAIVYLIGQRQSLKREVHELQAGSQQSTSDEVIVLQSDNRKDTLQLKKDNILFIRAEDNYVAVSHVSSGDLKEILLRSTLSSLEELLRNQGFVSCHRSYLVNLANVQRLRRGTTGYVLEIRAGLAAIPVSRTFLPAIRKAISPAS